jgi:hypothetical protein
LIAQLNGRIQQLGVDKECMKVDLKSVCASRDRYAHRAAELQRTNAQLELRLRQLEACGGSSGKNGAKSLGSGKGDEAAIPDLEVSPSACALAKRVVGTLNATKHAASLLTPRVRRSLSEVHVDWDELSAAR